MHLTELTPLSQEPLTTTWKKAAQVIVDWTQMPADASENVQLETDHLMHWVRSYPQRAAVHVYLRRSNVGQRDRHVQNTLQSLGCRVTMRSPQPAAQPLNNAADRSFW